MESFHFELIARDPHTGARRGRLHTAHGTVETPAFMPVGTRAAVKAMAADELEALGAELLLANTYHLWLRPGAETVRELGGLHGFAAWPRPWLTDSGGYQVFSLAALNKIEEEGVRFRSHLDGSERRLTPEGATEAQLALGADILMAFDDCTPYPADEATARASMERSLRWAARCRARWQEAGRGGGAPRRAGDAAYEQALFAIVQGGMHAGLRRECAARLAEMDFPGYGIGGLSVGEPRELTREVAQATLPALPEDKPRYLMGVGTPAELVHYAGLGVDLFDCVLPTRNARNGVLFTPSGRMAIKNAAWRRDPRPIDEGCGCRVCRRYSRAYLRHLFVSGEMLAGMLNTHHNLYTYLDTMRRVRHSIELGRMRELCAAWSAGGSESGHAAAPGAGRRGGEIED